MRPVSLRAAAIAAAVAGVLLTAVPAEAHTTLTAADPGKGTTVTSPAEIKLTFADPVRFPGVVVLDARHGHHESGKPQAVDNHVTQQISEVLAPGTYTVGWRVVAPDGHPVTGEYTFTVKGAGSTASPTGAAPAGATTSSPDAQPAAKPTSSAGWWWVGLVLIILAAASGGVTLLRRRR